VNDRRRLLVLLGVLAGAFAAAWTSPRWTAAALEVGLSRFFGRASSVGKVRFHAVPLSIEVLGIRVAGPTAAAPPFLEVPRIVAEPGLSLLWLGDVALSRLLVEEPKIRLRAFASGGDDIPRFRLGGAGRLSARVARLVVDRGELMINHERIPVALDLPGVRGRLGARRGGVLTGSLALGPGLARFGDAPPIPLSIEMDLVVDGADVNVVAAHVTARGTDVAYNGRLRLGSPLRGDFALKGPVDLGILDRHVLGTGLGLAGSGDYQGHLSIEGSAFHLEGRMEGQGGAFEGVEVPRFRGRVSWRETGVRISDLELDALGGNARLDLDVPRGRSRARARGHIDGMDAEGLVRTLFALGPMGVDASATGDLDLQWPRGRIRLLSGVIRADLAPRGDGRTATSGRFEWTAQDGVQQVERGAFKTPFAWLDVAGRVEVDDRIDLAVELHSNDLAATDALGSRLRSALGVSGARVAGFGGAGVFQGRCGGTLGAPVFQGRFTGRNVAFLGVTWGNAEWAGIASMDDVSSRSLVVHRPGGELWLDGRTETGEYAGRDGVDVRLRFTTWPAGDFIKALGWQVPIAGPLSGTAEIHGRRSVPFGTIEVGSSRGRWRGIPYSELALKMRLRGDRSEVESGRAAVGGGRVTFKGVVTDEGEYDGSAAAQGVDVADIFPRPAPGVAWGGRVSGSVSLRGPLARPVVKARLSSPRLFLGDEGVGALDATFTGDGDGEVSLDVRCRSARVDLAATGRIGAEAPHPMELAAVLHDTSLDPFLREMYSGVPGPLAVVVSGDAHLAGPLASPRDLVLEVALPALEVGLPEITLRNREPVDARIQEGRLELVSMHLTGEDTDLTVAGTAAVVGDGPLDLAARGSADLALAGLVSPRLRGRGAASLSLQLGGTLGDPRVDGRLDVAGAGFRIRGFPHGLDDVRGTLRFTEKSAEVDEATGTVGGGTVTLSGQAAYGRGRSASFDLRVVGHRMTLRYPEGLRSVVDADLRVFGDASTQWMTGDIDVRQALWTRRYDLASELLASAPTAGSSGSSPAGGLRFDLKVRVPGTLTVDNNLATLKARATLTLQGTDKDPVILGRAEVDHGRVYFQGNTYIIRRGTIDFTDPRRIDPRFDIEADARVRTYRVTLKVNGTLERVYPTLTSDPPLTALQILNLLAGADENTVAGLQTQADQARLAATGAATLAAGKIAEEVGLERGAERLLGLNRFSIDPSVVRGGLSNPTARITLGKRITPDLSVQYSLDLRGTQERILSLEYTLSDRLSVLLTSSQTNGVGFDIEMRHSR
jgi:TamB, inner membrane protein subunit of TAM complex